MKSISTMDEILNEIAENKLEEEMEIALRSESPGLGGVKLSKI